MDNKIDKTKYYQRPTGWGDDELSSFMIQAEQNGFASFLNAKSRYKKLQNINYIFNKAIKYMSNSSQWFELLFFIKAHGSFLAATRIGLATQVSEATPLIRSIIEYSLYGFFIHCNSEYGKIWLKRHDGEEEKQKVKDLFKIGDMLNTLEAKCSSLGVKARILYNQSIDYGAHPNEKGLFMAFNQKKEENTIAFNVSHLTEDPVPIAFCLKFIAQTAVLSLRILKLILPERFEIIGLDDEIKKISKDL